MTTPRDYVALDFALEQWVRDAIQLDTEALTLLDFKLMQAREQVRDELTQRQSQQGATGKQKGQEAV